MTHHTTIRSRLRLESSILSMAQEPPVWTRVFLVSRSLISSMPRTTHLCPRGSGNLFSSEFAHSWTSVKPRPCHVIFIMFVMSCHISCHVIFMHVMSWHIYVCYVIHVIKNHVPCQCIFKLCHVMSCHVMSYSSCLSCHDVFMYVISCHVMSYSSYVMSCHDCLFHVTIFMSCDTHAWDNVHVQPLVKFQIQNKTRAPENSQDTKICVM